MLSADVLHKSDIGGVRLGVGDRTAAETAFDDRTAAETAFDEILAPAHTAQPDAAIDGCLVAPTVTESTSGRRTHERHRVLLVHAQARPHRDVPQDESEVPEPLRP